jgi:hypothetical protein
VYSNLWSPGLRQGDIVGEIPFPLHTKKSQFLTSPGTITGFELVPEMAIVQAKKQYVAVVSHDCEFNEDKRQHFLVAKVEVLQHDLTKEQLATLRAENDIEASGAAQLDTFYLDPIDGTFDRPRRVNFWTITPFAVSALDQFKSLKRGRNWIKRRASSFEQSLAISSDATLATFQTMRKPTRP